jgi:hypothetical protein
MTVIPLAARTHPAILRAQEVYNSRDDGNRLRDLTDAEATFLASVHLITTQRAKSVGIAVRQFGDLTEAYWCVVRLADAQERDDLTHALEVFEAGVDADDEVEEVELAMAAE